MSNQLIISRASQGPLYGLINNTDIWLIAGNVKASTVTHFRVSLNLKKYATHVMYRVSQVIYSAQFYGTLYY
jgi:hypothetical protein